MTMSLSELRQSITALKRIAETLPHGDRFSPFLEEAAMAAEGSRVFSSYTKLANTAALAMEECSDSQVRLALGSLAFHAYDYCVSHSAGGSNFAPSKNKLEAITNNLGGALSCLDALASIRTSLEPEASEARDDTAAIESSIEPHAEKSTPKQQGSTTAKFFEEATSVPISRRFGERLALWRREGEVQSPDTSSHVTAFEKRLRRVLAVGEHGRKFGGFASLESDLADITADLARLDVPTHPHERLERAQICRNLAPVEFRMADGALYRTSRQCWLISAFWNSTLTDIWATNEEQFVYDILGYLTVLQAENRYATHIEGVLLLLRVSHLICRIASSDELLPSNFYEKSGRIENWVRYAVGTVLAISGPGRVPPSRVRHDPRFVDERGEERSREEFGQILLPQWHSQNDSEAASAVILELAGWKLSGAVRLLRTTLKGIAAESELWTRIVGEVLNRAARVKVLKPNPWAEVVQGKLITADTYALSILASDVIHRTFPSLESDISLNGTSFRARRVPTFVCSADFGPLGLFKADAKERVAREAENFMRFAQRLHPRYRASRCDKSIAAISEPDDRIEFVSGLLTSYVFTAREAPRSLNRWYQDTAPAAVMSLIDELFNDAVKPWYQHAMLGVVDITAEYPICARNGLLRLTEGLASRNDLVSAKPSVAAIKWLDAIMSWAEGNTSHTGQQIEQQAADLQLCETLRAVTHGDLHLDNIMVLGKPGAEYPCLIDFETTGEAHLLRDFGRFSAAILFRTNDWTPSQAEEIRKAFSQGTQGKPDALLNRQPHESAPVVKALDVINAVWRSYLQYWRAGAQPSDLEIVATLVCSYLPFARFPDTTAVAAALAMNIAGDLTKTIWGGGEAADRAFYAQERETLSGLI